MTRRHLGLAVGIVLATTNPAGAQSLDDYLSHGFTVVRATAIKGVFNGCRRHVQVQFEDGSLFACAHATSHLTDQPKVYILRHDAEPASVVLIGAVAYAGSLMRLGTHSYATPLSIQADALADPPAPPSPALSATSPLGTIFSINMLQAFQSRELAHAQPDPLPPHPRPGLSP